MSVIVSWVRASRLGVAVVFCGLALMAGLSSTDAAEHDLLTFGVGAYDVIDQDDSTAAAQVEYMSAKKLWVLNPFAGVMGTFDSAAYGYVGLAYDWQFGAYWVLTPSVAAGLYAEGDGLDLGSVVEFRSAVQLAYQFDNEMRLGLLFFHMSNAGIADENPGSEVLMATYGLPLGR